jgi:disulfide oxidoreductase YuzD
VPSAKAAEAIRASLGRLYGAEVEVHYYDVGDPVVAGEHANLLSELALERVPLPALLLDGVLISDGTIDPLRVVATVAEVRQRQLADSELETSGSEGADRPATPNGRGPEKSEPPVNL